MMVAIAVIAVVVILLYVEVYFYEGVHLAVFLGLYGQRIQARLYNSWAGSYDRDKSGSQARDGEMLARPLIAKLGSNAVMLDVAAGTGRLSAALFEAGFTGQIVVLDISEGMLTQARQKLVAYQSRALLLRHTAVPLPFSPARFDAVACLEALELMPDMRAALTEFARVLRPGGVLLTSRGREESGRTGQVKSQEQFEALLLEVGFEQVEISNWWSKFDLVWAKTPGQLTETGAGDLPDMFCCPGCSRPGLIKTDHMLRCQSCLAEVPIRNGIVLWPW